MIRKYDILLYALCANFDRHKGNWGYISNKNTLSLAPTYDYGSTLFPRLSDYGREKRLDEPKELLKRTFVFPTSALLLTRESGKNVGYYDMLCSAIDDYATRAVRKIVPLVDMNKINAIIDNTPLISDTQKLFYKEVLTYRKRLILDVALHYANEGRYDKSARHRLRNNFQINEEFLDLEWSRGTRSIEQFYEKAVEGTLFCEEPAPPLVSREQRAEKECEEKIESDLPPIEKAEREPMDSPEEPKQITIKASLARCFFIVINRQFYLF